MLTADLAQSWRHGARTGPRLLDPTDEKLLRAAGDLISIVRLHAGETRGSLQAALDDYIGSGTDYRILRGLIKLLTDVCEFETAGAVEPAELRRKLFLAAREHHPVLPLTETRIGSSTANESGDMRDLLIASVALEHNSTTPETEACLYADLAANQRLTTFDEPEPAALLDRYNLAQAQALLYRATEMRLQVAGQEAAHARAIFDSIKAYGLVHSITGSAHEGYEVVLTGPVSLFHRSQKYGVQMAVFLPALLLCAGWRMRAEIASPDREADANASTATNLFYELGADQDALHTHLLPAPRHSNKLDAKLIAAWERAPCDWKLEPTSEVIDLGATAFVPDLVAEHAGGKRVHIEIFGFWTPAHLARRTAEFDREGFRDWIIIASDELRCSREPPASTPANFVTCKTAPDAADVRSVLDRLL